MEDRGRTREEEPHGVGQEGGGRRAVAVEVMLHGLDRVFAWAPGAGEVCVEQLGGGGHQGGDHKAGVIVRLHDFRLEDHPRGACPGPGGLDELVIEAATGRRRLAMGVRQGDSVAMETPRLLERGCGLPEDGIAGEAKDKICPAVGGDHLQDFQGSKMTIATD